MKHLLFWAVTNGRFPEMEQPLRRKGLYWYFQPVTESTAMALQNETLQHEAEPSCLTQEIAAFSSVSFNFIHCTHARQPAAAESLRVIGSDNCDQFHCRLNLTVRLDPLTADTYRRLNGDRRYVASRNSQSIFSNVIHNAHIELYS